MKIPFAAVPATSKTQPWCLLELNGDLYMPPSSGSSGLVTKEGLRLVISDGKNLDPKEIGKTELGRLRFSEGGESVLTVGSHEMKGKRKKLGNKVAIIKKRKGKEGSVEYVVVGSVEEKLTFEEYPKLIIRKQEN